MNETNNPENLPVKVVMEENSLAKVLLLLAGLIVLGLLVYCIARSVRSTKIEFGDALKLLES